MKRINAFTGKALESSPDPVLIQREDTHVRTRREICALEEGPHLTMT